MSKKISVLLDYSFLSSFLSKKLELNEEDQYSDLETWLNLFGFLRRKCKITMSVKDIANLDMTYVHENSFARSLIDAYYQGSENVLFIENFPESMEEIDYFLIQDFKFIFSSNETLNAIEDYYGIEVVTTDTFISNWKLFAKIPEPFPIPRRASNQVSIGWKWIEVFRHPINALIIADRYLFSYYWNIENNLFPLLRALLAGQKLDVTFDFTILTEKIYQNTHTKREEDCTAIFERIEDFLKNELDFKSINLTFCKLGANLGSMIHDRQLFTNYFFIDSGIGFGCFDQFGNSALPASTKVGLVPISTRDNDERGSLWDYFINEKLEVMEHQDATAIGSKANRLFNHLQ